MKRKTFVKQLMALGVSRNEANSMCRDALSRRDRMSGHGKRFFVAYGNAFAYVFFNYSFGVHLTGRLLTMEERRKFREWRRKRTKDDPIHAWRKKHPFTELGGNNETMA